MGYATYPSFFVFQGGLPSLRLPCSNCLQLAVYTSGPIAPSKPSSAGPQSYPLPLSYRAIHHQRPVRAQLPPPRLRWTDGRMSCQLESPSCSRRRRSVPSTPGKQSLAYYYLRLWTTACAFATYNTATQYRQRSSSSTLYARIHSAFPILQPFRIRPRRLWVHR